MFFPERVKSIEITDFVLEVGPGGIRYPRADVLLELRFDDTETAKAQRGNTPVLQTSKSIVYYDDHRFPFADGAFDYVVCSHVLEHVDDVEAFMSEVFRVAPKGYMEYPLVYYDYLYNFDVHLNFLKLRNGTLCYLKKADTSLADFTPVQSLFYRSLEKGHVSLVNSLLTLIMEGFEWVNPFAIKKAQSIQEVCLDSYDIPSPPTTSQEASTRALIEQLLKRITGLYSLQDFKRY